jgi:ferredoxin-thioredoxin reductase catalytic subunit
MNGLCERTWQSLRNLAFSYMNYARVGLEFGDMALEHAWKVMAVLPLKHIHRHGSITTPYELYYCKKPSLRKFRVLFCPCVYKIHEREKRVSSKIIQRFSSKNHPQRGVIGLFIGFPQSHAGYLIWEPHSKTI